MRDDLRDLYQDTILEHAKKPRNFRSIEDAHRAEGHNPLCGDRVTVFVKLDGDRVADVSFVGDGCAISKASSSVMTETLKGRTLAEAEALYERFHELVTGRTPLREGEELGKLEVFAGVSEFPARVKCASLAWHTLHAALHDSNDLVTTE